MDRRKEVGRAIVGDLQAKAEWLIVQIPSVGDCAEEDCEENDQTSGLVASVIRISIVTSETAHILEV